MKVNTDIFIITAAFPAFSLAFAPSSNDVLRVQRCMQLTSSQNTYLQSTVFNENTVAASEANEQPNPLPAMDNIPMSEDSKKSYLDDGFVFGLDGSGLERPKGKQANIVVEGDSLETTPQQVGFVAVTFLGHALIAANAVSHLFSQTDGNVALTAAASLSTIAVSYILADFGSGVLHWSVDNYGNGRTPIMGSIIAAFQGHHSAPWTITYRGFCNNVYKLCVPFGLPTVATISYLAGEEHPLSKILIAYVLLHTVKP